MLLDESLAAEPASDTVNKPLRELPELRVNGIVFGRVRGLWGVGRRAVESRLRLPSR